MSEPVTAPYDPTAGTPPTVRPDTVASMSLASTGAESLSTLTTAPAPGSQRGRFTILKEHASGGLGKVSVALDARLKRQVALKEIRPDRLGSAALRERFLTEAEITGMLEHPGIVPVYALDEDEQGQPYYAMRFVQGRTLSEAISTFHRSTTPGFGSLAFRELLQRFLSVCQTIAYAHSKGVIHRDLKPANVMLGDYGETLVLDWGLAKVVRGPSSVVRSENLTTPVAEEQRTADHGQLTMEGQVLGTAHYMSPEQARGEELGPAADIYALGAILYELLTGRPPYEGRSVAEVLAQVRSSPPPDPLAIQKQAPKPLAAICRKAMGRATADRYPAASDLAKEVERYLADEAVAAYREPWRARAARWMRRRRTLVASGTAVLLMGAVALAIGLFVVTRLYRDLDDAYESAKESQADTDASFRFLCDDVLSAARPHKRPGGLGIHVTLKEALDAARLRIDATLGGRPRAQVQARAALGTTYGYIGDYQAAVVEFEKALPLARQAYGEDHEVTLSVMLSLANGYQLMGRLPEAVGLFEAVREHHGRGSNPHHPQALVAIEGLATAYRTQGRLAEAVSLHEQVSQRNKDRLGSDHPQTLRSLGELAHSYLAAGRRADAVTLLERIVPLQEAVLGPDDPDQLTAVNNLANVYQETGRFDRAAPLLEQTLRIMEEKLGSDHPDTLIAANNLAIVYERQSRYAEALLLFERVLRQTEAKLGRDHQDSLISLNNLANIYAALGRDGEALPLHERALKGFRAKLGAEHPETLRALGNLAVAYDKLGRSAEAIPLLEEATKLRSAKLGADHPDTIVSMRHLADAYVRVGRPADAIPLLQGAVARAKDKLGSDHPDTLTCLVCLASAYGRAGRVGDALPVAEEALQAFEAKLGPEHPDTLATTNHLAELYRHAGRLNEALPLYEKAFRGMRSKLGANHASTLVVMHNLGDAYSGAGRATEGLPILETATQGLTAQLGPRHPQVILARKNLGFACWRVGRVSEAATLFEQVLEEVRTVFGAEHPETYHAMINLGTCRTSSGAHAAAEQVLLECHTALDRNAKATALRQTVVVRLVALYDAWGKRDEAENWLAKLPQTTRAHYCLQRHYAWPILWGWTRF